MNYNTFMEIKKELKETTKEFYKNPDNDFHERIKVFKEFGEHTNYIPTFQDPRFQDILDKMVENEYLFKYENVTFEGMIEIHLDLIQDETELPQEELDNLEKELWISALEENFSSFHFNW